MSLDNYYQTINTYCNDLHARNKNPNFKILNISKIYGEIFCDDIDVCYKSNVIIDMIFIQEKSIPFDRQYITDVFTEYSDINARYMSFESFKNFNFEPSYDVIIIDTVHYKKYLDYILQNIIQLCDHVVFLHDTLPPEHLTFDKRTTDVPWCGKTYLSFYNFCLSNPTSAFVIADGYVGYGLIKMSADINFDYDTSNDISLAELNEIAVDHEQFISQNNN